MFNIKEIDFSEVTKPNNRVKNVKDDIDELVQQFIFQIPTPDVRKHMCNIISQYLDVEIIDRTTDEMVHKGIYFFLVKVNDKEISLLKYVDNIVSVERKNKIIKIKQKL